MKTIIKLHAIAMYLNKKLKEMGFNVNYEVKNVYSDFGLGTTHETIVVSDVNGDNRFQIFSPAELEQVEKGDFKPADADKVAEKHKELFEEWNVARLS